MTTEQNSPEPGSAAGSNPFLTALAWLWAAALVTAGIVALVGIDAYDGTVQFMWAGLLANLGVGALLVWLLACAIRWQPTVRAPVDSRPPNADAPSID